MVFVGVKLPQAHILPSASHFLVFSFNSTFRFAILSCFIPLRFAPCLFTFASPPPPNNPINARAPSLGPRLSLFSEVSHAVLACSGLSGGRDVAKQSQRRIRCECSRKRGRFHHVRCPYCKYLGALNRLMQP